MPVRQYARWRRRISLRDGAPGDRADAASEGYIRSCEVSGIVERAHGNVAGKPKRWLEHELGHAAETREASSQFQPRAVTRLFPKTCCNATSWLWAEVSGRERVSSPHR